MILFGWIGGLLGLLSLGLVLWKMLELGRMGQSVANTEARLRGEFAREASLRVKADLRFRLFVECARAAEEVTRTLVTWAQELTVHATAVVFEPNPETYRLNVKAEQEQLKAAQRVGLFLPPELDPPLYRTLKVFTQAMAAMAAAHQKPEVAERRDLCRPAIQSMEQELETFLNSVRVWKKRGFSELVAGEGSGPDSVSDPPSPGSQPALPRAHLPSFAGTGNDNGMIGST